MLSFQSGLWKSLFKGPPHDVTVVGGGNGVEEDRHRGGGDLGVAGVQLPPHVRHELVVLQPDEEVEGEGLEGV